jgi:hypothetical protein
MTVTGTPAGSIRRTVALFTQRGSLIGDGSLSPIPPS